MKPASIRGPISVSGSTEPGSVPIRGVVRGGRLKMIARDAAPLLGLSHQRVHQLTQNEAEEQQSDVVS